MEQSQKSSNGFGVTALVVGIVAFLFGWTGIPGLLLATVAVVFGILALVKKQSKGMGITGIVLGSLALVTALFITLAGLAILGGAAKVVSDASSEQKALENTKKDFAVGETAAFDQLQAKVNTFTPNWTATDGYSIPNDGYEFAFVSLNLKNTSDKTVSVNPFDFKINDAGVVSDHDFTTTATPFNAVDLKAGATIDGELVFQVKKGATGLKLEYTHFNDKALKEFTYTLGL